MVFNRESKWSVAEEEMSGRHYPDFLSGWYLPAYHYNL